MENRVTCDTCKANRVCDHNRFGFETCGNYIPSDVVPRAEVDEIIYKLECLLCHATGGRLSKHTYELRTMETVVTDYINESYSDGYADAYKEVAREIFAELDSFFNLLCSDNDDMLIYSEIRKKYIEGSDNQ